MTVAWCLSNRKQIGDAFADLRCREETTNQNIACLCVAQPPTPASSVEEIILTWAQGKNLYAIVWTGLKSNFEEKEGDSVSVEHALAYIQKLPPNAKAKAAEYIWRAPKFVKTGVRSALESEPWFTKSDEGPE